MGTDGWPCSPGRKRKPPIRTSLPCIWRPGEAQTWAVSVGVEVVVGFRIQVGWHQKSNGITLPKQTCFLKVDMLWHANLGICRTSEGDDGVICMSGHLAVVQLLAEAQPQAALATCRRDKNIQENSSSIPSQKTRSSCHFLIPFYQVSLSFGFKIQTQGSPKTTCKGGHTSSF